MYFGNSSEVDTAQHGKEGSCLSHFILTGGDQVETGYTTSNYSHSSGLTLAEFCFKSSPPNSPSRWGPSTQTQAYGKHFLF